MEENENSSNQQASAEAANSAKNNSKADGFYLPVLVEFTFTASIVLLMIIFLTMISISLVNGATLLDIVIRTSVTVLIIGGLLVLISRQIASDMFNAIFVVEKKPGQKQPDAYEVPESNSPSEVQ